MSEYIGILVSERGVRQKWSISSGSYEGQFYIMPVTV
jgi:hypothetical protein